jgi:hypothetical protein
MLPYSPDRPFNGLPPLPPPKALKTPILFRAALKANRLLAELTGYCQMLPNPELLLNTIALRMQKWMLQDEEVQRRVAYLPHLSL